MIFFSIAFRVLCVSVLLASAARAEGICDDLKKILSFTEVGYRPLQSGFDFYLDEYKGSLIPLAFSECYTSPSEGSSEYKCLKKLPDDEALARRELANLIQEVEECFGSQIVRRTGTSAQRPSYRKKDTGESISMSISRYVPKDASNPPRYGLRLRVSIIDPSAD
jgi:hypothetical protein